MDEPIIQLNVTEDELKVILFAVESFHQLVNTAPLAANQVSRSDAMRTRRAVTRFHERITSLGKAYGIEV